jgi:hypothetical protein
MFFFTLSMITLSINLAAVLYITAYLPYVKKVPEKEIDIEKIHPVLIPGMTISGFLSFFW